MGSFKKCCIMNICRVKVAMIKIVSPVISDFVFVTKNKISNDKINKTTEIGSP